jgi:RNA 3'-terminal phosphate cyclase (ATP)
MIEIDGSYGEGGGQIVRTAVALSAVTGKPVRIKKIRQGRPKPGLAPQHAQAISALARLCSARITGAEPGSPEISFDPGEIRGGHYQIDIGTAGSITLLMQCLMPATFKSDGTVTLEIRGGTDVKWSPTIDYFKNVFLPALARFRAKVSLEIRQRGYYPKGQGAVILNVEPGDLQSARLTVSGSAAHRVDGISHSSNLPEHVARRQAESALQALKGAGYDAEVSSETLALPSTGSGITIWSRFKGASALGERGLPAEKVGRKAAEEMISEMTRSASVDVHLADQLIPYIALAGGSYTTREISMHARTNMWTAMHFLDREIKILEEREKIFRIEAA